MAQGFRLISRGAWIPCDLLLEYRSASIVRRLQRCLSLISCWFYIYLLYIIVFTHKFSWQSVSLTAIQPAWFLCWRHAQSVPRAFCARRFDGLIGAAEPAARRAREPSAQYFRALLLLMCFPHTQYNTLHYSILNVYIRVRVESREKTGLSRNAAASTLNIRPVSEDLDMQNLTQSALCFGMAMEI